MKILYKEELVKKVIELIKSSNKELNIVSPYIDDWDDMYNILKELCEKNVKINFYIRDDNRNDDLPYIIAKYEEIGIKIYHIEYLHAKIFINDNEAIIGSLNLTEFAFAVSEEIGGLTDTDEEYKEIFNIFKKKIILKIKSLDEKLKYLESNVIKTKKQVKIKMDNDKVIVEHPLYKISIFIKKDKLNSGGHIICFDICSDKLKIDWLYKNIPYIKRNVYNSNFTRDGETLKMIITKPLPYSSIEELIEKDFIMFKYKINDLVSSIENFIDK
ncbi:MAG: phospholipase D-like domain-containing protein [Treponema sp.]|nr:phospholipase D-like domain-containing protein [Treponema sp.]MCL2252006.1 phospholipase D-like domain-containing protein [Treponema sp.]